MLTILKATLMANTEAAVARGAFGVPAFYVGEEMFLVKIDSARLRKS
jgi:2-hydroxychromene-2-carboxylate isomerase